MSEWITCTLGEVAEFIQTGPFGSQLHQSDYSDNGIPVVMPQDMVNGRIDTADIARVEQHHVDRLKRHKLQEGDIVYSRRGDVGRCAYVEKHQQGWLCGTGCLLVRLDKAKVHPRFIAYYLRLPSQVTWVENNAVGITMLNLNTGILSKAPLRIPRSIDEQKRIADTLESMDAKIKHNIELTQTLEEQAQLVYDYWFMQFDFPDENGRPYRSSGGKMVWSEELKREIPEGWDVDNITAVATIESGGTPSTKRDEYWNGHIPFYTPKDATDGFIATACTARYVTDIGVEESTTQVYERAVFLTARGTVGRVQMPRIPMAMNQSCYAICPRDGESLTLTYHMVKSIVAALKVRAHGAVFDAIITGDILSVKLPIPHRSLRQLYQQHTEAILKRLVDIAEEQERLTTQRDFLLPLLMSGQVTVAD